MAGSAQETFSIGDLARRTGLSVPTLRAWERRYALLKPHRSPGGHRRYGEEDLHRVNAVRALVDSGVALAAAAGQVRRTSSRDGLRETSRATVPLPPSAVDPQALQAAYHATRLLVHIGSPGEAVDVLIWLVGQLGGDVVPAEEAGPDAVPLDLSLGERPPLRPVAEQYSIARLRLERVLPGVVEDARRAAAVARRLAGAPE